MGQSTEQLLFVRAEFGGGKNIKTNHTLALAVLGGIASGFTGATTINAQQVKAPPAYLIAELDVTDAATFQKYQESVGVTVAAFNGHFVVRRGKIEARGRSAETLCRDCLR